MTPKKVKAAQRIINLSAPRASTAGGGVSGALTDLKSKIAQGAKAAIAHIRRNESNRYYFYGEVDNLPNAIIGAVDNSGTATACVDRISQFVQADGFIAEGLDGVKVNARQTMLGLLEDLTLNEAYLEGFALRLIFDNEGNIVKLYNLDIKTLRRKGKGFEYNPLMGESGKTAIDTRDYPEYDPGRAPEERRRIIAKQVKQHGEQLGEVLYVFRKGLGLYYDVYPVPRFYASIEDVISDGKISRLDLRNISQGFRTPVIISTGPIDDQNEDEDGNTAQDYFDEALQEFTGEDASPILHLKGNTEEFKPSVTTINVAEILDQTDRASDRIAKRVARIFSVPEVLIGIAKEGQLGNVQEVKNQLSLFALTVYKRQARIKEAFDLIKAKLKLPGLPDPAAADFTLSTLKPFDFIPDAVIANLTPDEQKELFEIDLEVSTPTVVAGEAVAITGANSTLANLTGRQLQGIQRVVRKFNKDELTYDQAAQLLTAGFAFTEEQVSAWLITKDEEEEEDIEHDGTTSK
jgi:hypothetical protein